MLTEKLMNKLNCNSFSKEQLDIIETYENKDKKLFLHSVYASVIYVLLNQVSSNIKFSLILFIIYAIFMGRYLIFKITKIKSIIFELRKNMKSN